MADGFNSINYFKTHYNYRRDESELVTEHSVSKDCYTCKPKDLSQKLASSSLRNSGFDEYKIRCSTKNLRYRTQNSASDFLTIILQQQCINIIIVTLNSGKENNSNDI